MFKKLVQSFLAFLLCFTFSGCSSNTSSNIPSYSNLENVPAYNEVETPYVVLNDNMPYFTEAQLQDTNSRIELSELDALGRCGSAYEVVSREMLPKEDRGDISGVYPSGWHQEFYGGKALWNRSHLLAFSLSGLNDEKRNLITGTAEMNQDVMTDFEAQVREYVQNTTNHVVYRVTPHFVGNELVARGVQMEAYSVEDEGKGVCYNVYLYNVQNGVNIDYETGYSSSSDYVQEQQESTSSEYQIDPEEQRTFVVNGRNGKFHTTECGNAQKISSGNRQEMVSTARDMENQGYEASKCCIK